MGKYRFFFIFFVAVVVFGCSPIREDYSALTTWEYINESSYLLTIEGAEEILNYNLAKNSKHTFDVKYRTEKDVSENDFHSPYRPEFTKITLDGERVVTTSPITDKKNYTAKKVSDRHFQFTYTFTDADFPEE